MGAEINTVRELLERPRSAADFSPAARYAVQRLCDYAAREHEQYELAEERYCQVLHESMRLSSEMARQARTIDDLRQQLSFLRQAVAEMGV